MSVEKAIHAKLSATPEITGSLATFQLTGVTMPAIFTFEPAPRDCTSPHVTISGSGAGNRFECRDGRGGEPLFDVKLWGDKTRSRRELRELAILVWRTLDRCNLTIESYAEAGVFADYPTPLDDPDGFPGFRIPVKVRIMET